MYAWEINMDTYTEGLEGKNVVSLYIIVYIHIPEKGKNICQIIMILMNKDNRANLLSNHNAN